MKITIVDDDGERTWEAEGALLVIRKEGKFEAVMKGQFPTLDMNLLVKLLALLRK